MSRIPPHCSKHFFLLQAAEAGYLSTHLLALLLSRRDGSKRLGSLAATALQEAPPPGLADLHWMMNEHGPLAVRTPAILKTLFARIQGNEDLVRGLAQAVWEEVNTGITLNAFAPKISPAMRRPGLIGTSAEPLNPVMIKELAELASEVEELGPLRRYLALFPEGRISAFLVEGIFAARAEGSGTNHALVLADLPLAAEEDAVARSIKEIRSLLLTESLWPGSGDRP